MNNEFVGRLQPIYVATDGSLQYANDGTIYEDWGEIIVRLENGDSFSMLRGSNLKTHQQEDLLVVGEQYRFDVRFSAGMCNRSGQNMTILTATVESYKRV